MATPYGKCWNFFPRWYGKCQYPVMCVEDSHHQEGPRMMTESDAARVQVDTFPAHLTARQNVSSSNASSIPRLLGVVRPGVKPECICVDTFPGERLRFRSTTLDEVFFAPTSVKSRPHF